jgi:hypothetical protein
MNSTGENQVRNAIHAGAILVKNDTSLPAGLQFPSEPCVPGWSLVNGLDGHAMDREIQKKGWTFFSLAGQITSIAFGINEHEMVRRAIGQILTNPKSQSFNSLEITEVASKRFLGLPYARVTAQSRHIQESMFLCSAADGQEAGRTKLAAAEIPTRASRAAAGFASEETTAQKRVVTESSL